MKKNHLLTFLCIGVLSLSTLISCSLDDDHEENDEGTIKSIMIYDDDSYYVGQNYFSDNDLTITATYSNGKTEHIDDDKCKIILKDSLGNSLQENTNFVTSGNYTVQVEYIKILSNVIYVNVNDGSGIANNQINSITIFDNETYEVGDIFAKDNGLDVVATLKSGYNKHLDNDTYSIIIKDFNNTLINAYSPFVIEGLYSVYVTYQMFTSNIITIKVNKDNDADTGGTIVSDDITSLQIYDYEDYKVGESYFEDNDLDVVAILKNGRKKELHDKTMYQITLKDSSGKEISIHERFTIAGTYSVFVTYKNFVSNTISIKVYQNNDVETGGSTKTKTKINRNFEMSDILSDEPRLNINSPSKGDVNLLVIPIEFADYPFDATIYSDLTTVFKGSRSETNYWYSVEEYYKLSSYGFLDLDFDIAPIYRTNDSISKYASNMYQPLLIDAIEDFSKNNSTAKYDQNKDGYIDAVWFIYSCHNGIIDDDVSKAEGGKTETYWAFQNDIIYYQPNLNQPTLHNFGFASYDFMYEATNFKKNKLFPKYDAHTFVHETGHLLGLEDYYSYESNYDSMGGLDIMSSSSTDQNVYSKMVLDWIDPYVVSSDRTLGTYKLKPSNKSADCLLIASNFNGTVFDEYLLVEFFAPTGLNIGLNNRNQVDYSDYGVKIYHVDARLVKAIKNNQNYSYFVDELGNAIFMNDKETSDLTIDEIKNKQTTYFVGSTNTKSYSVNEDYFLIQAITADKINTYEDMKKPTNNSLFKKGSVFTMDSYGEYFFKNKTKFNNGDDFNYRISIDQITNDYATISVSKV